MRAHKALSMSLVLILTGVHSTLLAESPVETGKNHAERRAGETWRFEFANDIAFDEDNQFTGGWRVTKSSAAVQDLDDLEGVWKFGGWFSAE